jgi:uncharacterized protein YecE (DUF72 family)
LHAQEDVARAYIGTSGWVYAGWREHLYADTPVKNWLRVASTTFDALEINGSFYTQIKPETYQRWYDETPDDFRFALKGHRFVTHFKRLKGCDESIVRLRDQVHPLREKLAAVVWQLPAHFEVNVPRLEEFCASLQAWPGVGHALELRHASWFTDEVAAILRAHEVAVCMGDAPDFPMWRQVTSHMVYARLHGHTRKYASSYSEASLRAWADATKQWLAEGRDVHVYFDNDAEGHAVRNAMRLAELVDGRARPAPPAHRYSGPAPCGSSRGEPWRRPTARPRSLSSSARRSTARTGSRGRRPSAR